MKEGAWTLHFSAHLAAKTGCVVVVGEHIVSIGPLLKVGMSKTKLDLKSAQCRQ